MDARNKESAANANGRSQRTGTSALPLRPVSGGQSNQAALARGTIVVVPADNMCMEQHTSVCLCAPVAPRPTPRLAQAEEERQQEEAAQMQRREEEAAECARRSLSARFAAAWALLPPSQAA